MKKMIKKVTVILSMFLFLAVFFTLLLNVNNYAIDLTSSGRNLAGDDDNSLLQPETLTQTDVGQSAVGDSPVAEALQVNPEYDANSGSPMSGNNLFDFKAIIGIVMFILSMLMIFAIISVFRRLSGGGTEIPGTDLQTPAAQNPMDSLLPFFTRFLEPQDYPAQAVTQKGPSDDDEGGTMTTMKAPSDSEEGGVATTLKGPSDDDEGAVGVTEKAPSDSDEGAIGVTKKAPSDDDEGGVATTMKAPSDDDEGAVGVTRKAPSDSDEGGVAVTDKAPSDSDEGAVYTTMKAPSDSDEGGVATTKKAPSDNDESGLR